MNKQVSDLLESKKIRITPVRVLVLETLINSDRALSQSDIEIALPWSDNVSIFRTLKTFEKKSLTHKINCGKVTKYALCSADCNIYRHKTHPHFHCEKCDKTTCLIKQNINIDNLPSNIIVKEYHLIINGLCSDCK